MNEHLPSEMQRYLCDLKREDSDKLTEIDLRAKLAAAISHPEILSFAERSLLERIRQDEPDNFQDLQMIAELSNEPGAMRPRCSRLVPFAHALIGFLLAGILLWWLGVDRRWVYYLAALPAVYALWNLKSALFDSQAKLDRNLHQG
jgi:hypothetical protein